MATLSELLGDTRASITTYNADINELTTELTTFYHHVCNALAGQPAAGQGPAVDASLTSLSSEPESLPTQDESLTKREPSKFEKLVSRLRSTTAVISEEISVNDVTAMKELVKNLKKIVEVCLSSANGRLNQPANDGNLFLLLNYSYC